MEDTKNEKQETTPELTAGTTKTAPPEATAPPAPKKQAKGNLPSFILSYIKAYPDEKAFHVTSDRQVFLEKDRNLAVLHQNSLKNGEQVQTIKAGQ